MRILVSHVANAGSFDFHGEILERMALAAVIGYVVGLEREFRGSVAGDRTFALVALGTAAVTAVGVLNFPASAEKVIAGVVTGLGFLGAGIIFRGQAGEPHGLTTAASLWSTAAAAILVGVGEYLMGLLAGVLVFIVLEVGHVPFMRRIDERMADRRDRGDEPLG